MAPGGVKAGLASCAGGRGDGAGRLCGGAESDDPRGVAGGRPAVYMSQGTARRPGHRPPPAPMTRRVRLSTYPARPSSISAARQPQKTEFRISMRAILDVIMIALDLYIWVLIASAIFSWLYAFNVVNPRNQVVSVIGNALFQLTEPVLRPIRNLLPNMGGLDLSPIAVLLLIFLIQRLIIYYVYPYAF